MISDNDEYSHGYLEWETELLILTVCFDNDRTWPSMPEHWHAWALRLETSSSNSKVFFSAAV